MSTFKIESDYKPAGDPALNFGLVEGGFERVSFPRGMASTSSITLARLNKSKPKLVHGQDSFHMFV